MDEKINLNSSTTDLEANNILLEKLKQLRELRQKGLLSSVELKANPLSLESQTQNSVTNSMPDSILSLSNSGLFNNPHPALLNQRNTLPLTTWTHGEDLFLFGCVPKCFVTEPEMSTFKGQDMPQQQLVPSSVSTNSRPLKRKRDKNNEPKRLSTTTATSLKQKRTKWTTADLITLWKSISIHGNEWQKVRICLTKRTYHQVKDKGKRLLHERGWKTGRSKVQNDLACEKAKEIARAVLSSSEFNTPLE